MNILPLLGAAFGLVRTKRSPYENAMARLAGLQSDSYRRYMPQLLAALGRQAAGARSPYLETQALNALAHTQQDYSRAFDMAAQRLGQRGLTPGGSNVYSGQMGLLARAMAGKMADIRQQTLGAQENRAQNALRLLAQLTSPTAGQANNAFTVLSQFDRADGYGTQSAYADLFAALNSLLGGTPARGKTGLYSGFPGESLSHYA